jgi:hypothetical protein
MNFAVVDFGNDRLVCNVTGCTKQELDNKLNLFFSSRGYSIKSETPENKIYKKGNRAMRIILGAFSKYYQFSVSTKTQNDVIGLQLLKDSTGVSGGLIGMRQVKKEFDRIKEEFKTYMSN